ncbi:DUF3558 domain-containing protein [Actinokineospora sp.]|uniref:DUF3558 domain-containing protein n=1 Tax=Actinokineospora sp. TaxID=1872133 RepID=UPI0040377EAF
MQETGSASRSGARLLTSRVVLLLVSVALVIGAAACTSTEPGMATTPVLDEPTISESPPPSSSSGLPGVTIPPRPEELKLDSVEPCALVTAAQRTQLTVNRARSLITGGETYRGMKRCALEVSAREPFYTYSVLLVTTEGIGPWLTEKRNVDVQLVTVGGFAAAQYYLKGGGGPNSSECTTSVDVANGQQLMVTMLLTSRGAFTQDQICQMSEQAAGLALTTLQTLG